MQTFHLFVERRKSTKNMPSLSCNKHQKQCRATENSQFIDSYLYIFFPFSFELFLDYRRNKTLTTPMSSFYGLADFIAELNIFIFNYYYCFSRHKYIIFTSWNRVLWHVFLANSVFMLLMAKIASVNWIFHPFILFLFPF